MQSDEVKKPQNTNASDLHQENGPDIDTKKTLTPDEQRIADLEEKVISGENKLKSALSDYQNILKEVETQRAFTTSLIKKEVFGDLIELFTDLYFGLSQLPQEMRENPHIVGVESIMMKYRDLLKKHGVSEIQFAEGDTYDPAKAEVVGFIPDAEKDGKVATTVQPGFTINDVMIKPARVMIFKKS